MKHTLLITLIGLVTVLITMRSILGSSFFRPHDYIHAARLVEMQRSLKAGEFPVRWSRNFGFGYGMPLFNFYAPLPYYVGQIPLAVGISPVVAIKFLYLLNGLLAFVGMFFFAGKLWGKWGGVISATVFSFSSYRALDLFVRGAVGEAFALTLIPLALYGVLLAKEKKKSGPVITVLALAAILLSHNLTGMVMVGLVALFWLVQLILVKRAEWSWQLLALILSLVFSLGLSAFYVLPAFVERNLTRVDQTITVGYFDYHNHFLCYWQVFRGYWGYGGSLPGCSDDVSFAFGTFSWILLGLGVVGGLWLGKKKQKFIVLVLLVGLVGSIFLCIGRSVFVWDLFALLKYFQFPWRFLTFAHVFLAVLSGASVLLIQKQKLFLPVVVLSLLLMVIYQAQYYLPEKSLAPSEWNQYYNTSPEWIRSETSQTLNDYLPPTVKDSALPSPVNSRFTLKDGEVRVEKDEPTQAIAKASCSRECLVSINIFQFPGWETTIDGKPAQLQNAKGNLPIYFLKIPEGEHEVRVFFTGSQIERTGNWISLVFTISAVAGVLLWTKKRPH